MSTKKTWSIARSLSIKFQVTNRTWIAFTKRHPQLLNWSWRLLQTNSTITHKSWQAIRCVHLIYPTIPFGGGVPFMFHTFGRQVELPPHSSKSSPQISALSRPVLSGWHEPHIFRPTGNPNRSLYTKCICHDVSGEGISPSFHETFRILVFGNPFCTSDLPEKPSFLLFCLGLSGGYDI